MIEEFSVDSKAECGQLNPAHVARNKKYKRNAGASFFRYSLRSVKTVQNEPEGLRRKGFVKEMSFKSGIEQCVPVYCSVRSSHAVNMYR